MNVMRKMEEMKDHIEEEMPESASSPISQEASSINANATTIPLSPSESSPSPPAPATTSNDPSQLLKSPPPVTSPISNASSSNSSAQKPDPGGGQSGSPPKSSSAPPPLSNASPPPPPASLKPSNNTPPPPVSTPSEPYPNFSPPPSPQIPSGSSGLKAPPPHADHVVSQPPTSSPPAQVVTPAAPAIPTIPVPPNSPLPINTSPPNPLTPDASTSPSTPAKPTPLTPPGGEAPTNATQGISASGNRNSYAAAPSFSHVSPSTGIVIAATVFVAVIAFVAVFFVILAKRKRRKNGLDKLYRPTLNSSIAKTEGQNNRNARNLGADNFHQVGYDVSGSPSSSYAGGISYESHGDYGYLAGTADAAGARSCFTYEELMGITSGFSLENKIGEGGFGSVYRGSLPEGRTVAVKQLKIGSGQGEREFRAEVEIISRIHHRHLVSLVGYCISEQHRLLVYEFVPNKTLEHHLHGKELLPLDWQKRVKIALGSARGLVYLHEYCHPRIIHRDIKSANILLDNSFEAMVADFGLAKLANDTSSHISTRVVGTFGYLAPEYAASGKLTDKSDVYSFGVVLLELIAGRKPVDISRALGEESLVEWARPFLVHALETGQCDELVDPKLDNNFPKAEMLRMIEVAASCVRHSAAKRPRMAQVLRALESDEEVTDISNGVKIGESVAYNSAQYSADIRIFQRLAFESQELSSGLALPKSMGKSLVDFH